MARKRVVSPELLTSESVASLPIPTRYAWVALWMYVDDEGRGRDNVALIRAHTWPLDESYTMRRVETDLRRLAEAGMICRYEYGGERLLHIPTWGDWQRINRPTPSRLVPCPHEGTGLLHEDSVRIHGGLTPKLIEEKLSEAPSREDSVCEHGVALSDVKRCPLCRRRGRLSVVSA